MKLYNEIIHGHAGQYLSVELNPGSVDTSSVNATLDIMGVGQFGSDNIAIKINNGFIWFLYGTRYDRDYDFKDIAVFEMSEENLRNVGLAVSVIPATPDEYNGFVQGTMNFSDREFRVNDCIRYLDSGIEYDIASVLNILSEAYYNIKTSSGRPVLIKVPSCYDYNSYCLEAITYLYSKLPIGYRSRFSFATNPYNQKDFSICFVPENSSYATGAYSLQDSYYAGGEKADLDIFRSYLVDYTLWDVVESEVELYKLTPSTYADILPVCYWAKLEGMDEETLREWEEYLAASQYDEYSYRALCMNTMIQDVNGERPYVINDMINIISQDVNRSTSFTEIADKLDGYKAVIAMLRKELGAELPANDMMKPALPSIISDTDISYYDDFYGNRERLLCYFREDQLSAVTNIVDVKKAEYDRKKAEEEEAERRRIEAEMERQRLIREAEERREREAAQRREEDEMAKRMSGNLSMGGDEYGFMSNNPYGEYSANDPYAASSSTYGGDTSSNAYGGATTSGTYSGAGSTSYDSGSSFEIQGDYDAYDNVTAGDTGGLKGGQTKQSAPLKMKSNKNQYDEMDGYERDPQTKQSSAGASATGNSGNSNAGNSGNSGNTNRTSNPTFFDVLDGYETKQKVLLLILAIAIILVVFALGILTGVFIEKSIAKKNAAANELIDEDFTDDDVIGTDEDTSADTEEATDNTDGETDTTEADTSDAAEDDSKNSSSASMLNLDTPQIENAIDAWNKGEYIEAKADFENCKLSDLFTELDNRDSGTKEEKAILEYISAVCIANDSSWDVEEKTVCVENVSVYKCEDALELIAEGLYNGKAVDKNSPIVVVSFAEKSSEDSEAAEDESTEEGSEKKNTEETSETEATIAENDKNATDNEIDINSDMISIYYVFGSSYIELKADDLNNDVEVSDVLEKIVGDDSNSTKYQDIVTAIVREGATSIATSN